jgi:hypothetical protein
MDLSGFKAAWRRKNMLQCPESLVWSHAWAFSKQAGAAFMNRCPIKNAV